MTKPAPQAGGKKRTLRERIAREWKEHYALYILMILPMAVLILFKYVPMYGVQIAFRDYKPVRGVTGSAWVGLKYFNKFFSSSMFWPLIRNTLSINLYLLATFPLALILALLLNYLPSRRFAKVVQMVSYAPHFISTVVMVGMLLQFLDSRTGVINILLRALGFNSVNFMGQPSCFYSIYVWSDVWQTLGYSSIIYISALSGISPELHEAAVVDGASILQRIWHVDIPGVLPTFCVLLIMRCGTLLSMGFEKILLLQNDLNKPLSEVISTYTYAIGLNAAKGSPQYSYFTGEYNENGAPVIKRVTSTLLRDGSSTQNRRWTAWGSRTFHGDYKSWVLELDPMSLSQRQIDASATYAQYAVQDGKPAVIWCSDADLQARVKELQALVTDYAKNMYSQFLPGTKDIYSDADWAEYEQGLKAAGVEEYCELLAEYWYGAK